MGKMQEVWENLVATAKAADRHVRCFEIWEDCFDRKKAYDESIERISKAIKRLPKRVLSDKPMPAPVPMFWPAEAVIPGLSEERLSLRYHMADQEIAPKHGDGIDYGSKGVVLFRDRNIRLVWRKGGKHWAHRGAQAYHPTSLSILGYKNSETSKVLLKGGRLTRKRLQTVIPEIRRITGNDDIGAYIFDFNKTVVVERKGKDGKWSS